MIKVAKFGGSSVADAGQFKKVRDIVRADHDRRFVVVSASGKRFPSDNKITDLLLLVNAHIAYHVDCTALLKDIEQRYVDIAEELGLKVIFALAINPGGPGRGGEATHDLADMRLSRERALDVVFRLSKRYASRMGFFGIELADDVVSQRRLGLTLTEGMPVHLLRNYYREAYELVRHAAGEEPVVIMPDGGIPGGWGRFMAQRHYCNVWLDCHLDRRPTTRVDVSGPSGVRRLVERNSRQLREAARAGMPVMVGKWSAALPIADSAMTPEGRIALERVFTSEQIAAYEKAPAWFFNTWKTSGLLPGWDARVAMATFERGMIA